MSVHQTPKKAIVGLDVLRFAAAVSVLCFHFFYLISVPGHTPFSVTGGTISFPNVGPVAKFGFVGVEIFFVISGFVISLSAAGSSPLMFLRARILRLAPAAWICATITFMVALSISYLPLMNLARNYLRSIFFVPFGTQIDGSYWTLGVEISFYFVVYFVILCKIWSRFENVVFYIAVMSSIYNILNFLNVVGINRYYDLALLRHGCEFSLGVVFYFLYNDGINFRKSFFSVFLSIISVLEIFQQAELHFNRSLRITDMISLLLIWHLTLTTFVVAVRFNDPLHNLLSERIIRVIRNFGLATYPLYLIHQLVGSAIIAAIAAYSESEVFAVIFGTLSVLVLAIMIVRLEEEVRRGLRALIDPYLKRSKPEPQMRAL